MVQEMTRRGCKGIGGINWDKMAIKERIVLGKWTGELVGFEDNNNNNNNNLITYIAQVFIKKIKCALH